MNTESDDNLDDENDEGLDGESDEFDKEIEVSFIPRAQALTDLGITDAEFESALMVALEEREVLANAVESDEDMPPLEEMLLRIGAKSYQLDELADIEISGDLS